MDNLIPLKHFGFLSVTGKDALKFLQGYTTCDLNDLQKEKSLLGAICNIQGRMVCNFRVILIEDGYLLRLNHDLISVTQAFLQKYIVFSKAKLEDLSSSYYCYGLRQDGTDRSNLPTLNQVILEKDDWLVGVAEQRFELWHSGEPLDNEGSNESLISWLEAEIGSGYAWVDEFSQSEYLPQMLNLHNLDGMSFEKGCYLGQEIVARMQHRGKLKKTLHQGIASRQIENGENLLSEDGRVLGKVVAAAKNKFLAVIQTKSLDTPQLQLEDGGTAEVSAQ